MKTFDLKSKLKEVKEIREKLMEEGYHFPLSWGKVKSAIIYNNKEQDKYKTVTN